MLRVFNMLGPLRIIKIRLSTITHILWGSITTSMYTSNNTNKTLATIQHYNEPLGAKGPPLVGEEVRKEVGMHAGS